ncbi:hypothetical protein LY474_19285 [Myxococcus stipitatus]|uniref:leucine-rich repeat domain-containing protein n=1 Tax=Myxococcus stipitatus TaxID=83455 RepID=UPI001F360541|nr:hypothetical protein [Myxococcus stipitatus]MCE9669946.1 hypothetical protein [Myxococcus stipitatus]
MDKSAFAERLRRAAERARDFARTLVIEPLPDNVLFDVELNCSYDGNPLHPDERVYPEDPTRFPPTQRSRLAREDVVELLWREGAAPEWINLTVKSEDGEHTLIELSCCGRFTANEHLLYHEQEGHPPFHVLGPSLPPSYDQEKAERFSLYWGPEVSSPRELATLARRSSHVETLVLSGPDLDDGALEDLSRMALPALRHLRLEKTHIQGPGLHHVANIPLNSLTWNAAPGHAIDLRVLAPFSRLKDLHVEAHGSQLDGVSALSVLRSLTSLHLRASSLTNLDALRSLEKLVELDLTGSPVTSLEALARSQRLHDLSLARTAVEDDDLRAVSSLSRLRTLALNETAVGDTGLVHVSKLPALRILVLDKTRVGDQGLRHLARLDLSVVNLRGTQVTKEGVAWLRSQRPRARIFSPFEEYTFPRDKKESRGGFARLLRALVKRR